MKMRYSKFRSVSIIWLLLAIVGTQAGLVHRQIRTENLKATVAPESLIPVQIIQEAEPLDAIKDQLDAKKTIKTEAPKKTSLLAGQVSAPKPSPDTTIEKLAATDDKLASVLISEPLVDKVLEQQFEQALADENKELLQEEPSTAAVLSEKARESQVLTQAQEINSELKAGVPAAAEDAAATIYFSAPETEHGAAAAEELPSAVESLKSESLIVDSAPAESEIAPVAVQALVASEVDAGSIPAVVPDSAAAIVVVDEAPAPVGLERQAAATQATPTQSSTQANFVQQLIQNSPIGQFLGQFAPQPQQQQQQAADGVQIAADQPATPAPTLPGFLNPQNAITQVQNAAQSVANATAQAFQGVQQFATSLGTQFQNTLSNFGGQPPSTADSTTTRPPGPIQSLISNFVGGNPTPAAAAAAAGATQSPAQQQQGPIQGIISFFQGGTRPQTPAAAGSIAPAPANAQLDNKVDEVNKVEPSNELTDAAHEPEEADQTDNEVRNSAEVAGADSLEDNSSGQQYIVVNDDVSQQNHEHEDGKSAAVV